MTHDHGSAQTVVLELDGLHWATQRSAVETTLSRRRGVTSVEANPAAQTATVAYDPSITSVAEIAGWIEECGYHCRGESVPDHVCGPVVGEADVPADARRGTPSEVMGHGGHGEMSMASMVRDMRNRFLVAVVFGIVITWWSMIGREVLNFSVAAPFGLRDDVFQLVLSLPVIFYSAQIFFAGAVRALRARTLDMMVLVAVAVGAGWVSRSRSP